MTKFEELFPLMYLINLDSRPDRLSESVKELQKINQGLMSYHDEDTRADKNRWLYYSRHTEKRCNGI